jgi:hypothetical protein
MPKRLTEPEHLAVQKLLDQLIVIINGRVPAKTIEQLNKLRRWEFDDDDDDPVKLAAKFKIDEPTYRKLEALKGDEALDILRLAARKNNPKGYVLTCIRNAEREVAEPITPSQMYDTFAPNHKLRIKVDEDDIREVTTNADGKVPRDVTRDITYKQHAKRERASKVRERLGIRD